MEDEIKLENGESVIPTDDTVIRCEDHNISVRWGDLSVFQQLAVKEGLDLTDQCILSNANNKSEKEA